MEARGFGSKGKKTFYKMITTTHMDYVFLILPIFLLLFLIIIWFLNIGDFTYYPNLAAINFNLSYIFLMFILVFLIASPALLSPLKKVIDLD
jgi:hypothetical protein